MLPALGHTWLLRFRIADKLSVARTPGAGHLILNLVAVGHGPQELFLRLCTQEATSPRNLPMSGSFAYKRNPTTRKTCDAQFCECGKSVSRCPNRICDTKGPHISVWYVLCCRRLVPRSPMEKPLWECVGGVLLGLIEGSSGSLLVGDRGALLRFSRVGWGARVSK
jgi:hypothetical protein